MPAPKNRRKTSLEYLSLVMLEDRVAPAFLGGGDYVVGPGEALEGTRAIDADVTSFGFISPGNSPGILDIDGDLAINGSYDRSNPDADGDPAGTVLIEVGGLTAGPGTPVFDDGFDQINVTGDVTVGAGSALRIDVINDFEPEAGQSFEFLNYGGTLTGTFDTVTGLYGFGDGGLYFDIEDDGDSLNLVVKEAPTAGSVFSPTQEINDALGQFYSDYVTDVAATVTGDLRIDEFVTLRGTFDFGVEVVNDVTVATGLPADAGDLFSGLPDYSKVENLNMLTLTIGAADVDAFVGFNGPYFEGNTDDDAFGLSATDIDAGFTLMTPVLDTEEALLLESIFATGGRTPAFWSLKATAEEFAFVGFDDVELSAEDVTVNVNDGVSWPGDLGPPVVDFATSFETSDGAGDGSFEVATGGDPVAIDFDGNQRLGFSSEEVTLKLADFVYVNGGFAFEKGPTTEIDIATGVPSDALDLLETLGNNYSPGLGTALKDAGTVIEDVEVGTFQVGASDVRAFVGLGGPYWNDDDTTNPDAVGLAAEGLDIGAVFMEPTIASLATAVGVPEDALDGIIPKFTALKATADAFEFVGIDDIELSAENITIDYNDGTEWFGEVGPPVVDFAASYPDEGGFEVMTGNDPVLIDFDGNQRIGFSTESATVRLAEFVYATGGFAFEQGPVTNIDIATGVPSDSLDALREAGNAISPGLGDAVADYGALIPDVEVSTFQVGASDVHAFVGVGGPYWEDGDGDGEIDDDELNEEALGLALEDLDIGLVVMQPTVASLAAVFGVDEDALDGVIPEFTALKATADTFEFVGWDDLELSAEQITVNYNDGTEWFGVVGPPVVDFTSSFETSDGAGDGSFEVGTGRDPVLIDFDGNQRIGFSSERITLQLSDFVHVTGGFSFEQGPVTNVDVATGLPSSLLGVFEEAVNELTDTTLGTTIRNDYATVIPEVEVATLQVGASDVHAFVGVNGPYWTDDIDGDGSINWVTPSGVVLAGGETITEGGVDYGDLDGDGVVDADETAELNDNAVGLAVEDVDLGVVIMEPTVASLAELFGVPEEKIKLVVPKFTAAKATGDAVRLVGFDDDELTLSATGITVNYNNGTAWPGDLGPPVVDFANTAGFADERKALFDQNADGVVTVGDLRTLTGQVGAAGGAFEGLWDADADDNDLLDLDDIADTLDAYGGFDRDGFNAEDTLNNGVLDVEEAEAALGTALDDGVDADGDGKLDALGFEVMTGNAPVYIDYDGNQRIGASANDVQLQISEFLHVRGSVEFEMGPVQTVAVGGGLLADYAGTAGDLLEDFGFPSSLVDSFPALGAASTEVSSITFGASNVHAFVGLDGPYWTDDLDGDRNISWVTPSGVRVPDGETITEGGVEYGDLDGDGVVDADETAELSEDAAGLVVNDFDFGAAILKPTNPLDFAKYTSLKATASQVALVGVDDVTAEATEILVEVNLSSPSVYGVPLFPVVDYATTTQYNSDQFALFDTDGDGEITVDELRALTGQDGIAGLYGDGDDGNDAVELSDIIDALDTTGDGLLSDAEAEAVGIDAAVVAEADADGDGFIEQFVSERAALFDTDRDGVIELGELAALPNAGDFADLDGIDPSDTTPVTDEDLLTLLDADLSGTISVVEATALFGDGVAVSGYDIDGDEILDEAGFEIGTGNEPVYLNMDSSIIRAQGFFDINVFDTLYVSGSVAFELGDTQDVTLTNGETVNVSTLTVGAANVTAFVGANGPYWADENGNFEVDDGELNEDSIGLELTDLDLGLAIMASTAPDALGVYLAGSASVYSFGTVGMPLVEATGQFDVAINVGLGVNGTAVIDFAETFDEDLNDDGDFDDDGESDKDGDGEVDQGFSVNTGNPDAPVVLDFDEFLINFQLGGIVTIYSDAANTNPVVRANGLALFEVDNDGLGLFLAAGLEFGPDIDSGESIFNLDALGGLVINDDGVAADIDISLAIGESFSDVFYAEADARIVFNTTGSDQSVLIPERYVQFLEGVVGLEGSFIEEGLDGLGIDNLDALSSLTGPLDDRFVDNGDGSFSFTIFGDAPTLAELFPDADLDDYNTPLSEDSEYFALAVSGGLTVAENWGLDGRFGVIVTDDSFQLSAEANLDLEPVGTLSANGDLFIDGDGVRARVSVFGTLGSDEIGLTMTASGLFEVNTSDTDWVVDGVTVGANSVGVAVAGSFNFIDFAEGDGSAAITYDDGDFQLVIDGTLSIGGGFDVEVLAYVGVFDDDTSTPTDESGVIIDASVSIDLSLLSLIDLDAAGRIQINTTGQSVSTYRGAIIDEDGNITGFDDIQIVDVDGNATSIEADSFYLDLRGGLDLLSVFEMSGRLTVTVTDSFWEIAIPASDPLTADLLGIITATVSGSFNSDGDFELSLDAGIDFTVGGTGLEGSLSIYTRLDVDQNPDFVFTASGSGSGKILGTEVAGIEASINVSGDLGETVPVRVTVSGTGTVIEIIENVISWLVSTFTQREVDVELSTTLTLFNITLPSSLETTSPPPPPLLASQTGGTLTLNVGDNASARNVSASTTAEEYLVFRSGDTVIVQAFGETERFDNVTSIVGNFGSDTDSATFLNMGNIDVNISGGEGNDSFFYSGTGTADIDGGAGNDTLSIGGTPSTSSSLSGGGDDDEIENTTNVSVALYGNGGDDTLTGGGGNDAVLSGGSGSDSIDGGAGADTVDAGAGNDTVFFLISDVSAGESISGGSDGDQLYVIGDGGPEDFRLSESGGVVTFEYYEGGTPAGSIDFTEIEDVVLSGGDGSDSFTVSGALDDGGVTSSVVVDLGDDGSADSVELTLSDSADTLDVVSGDGLLIGLWSGHFALAVVDPLASDGDTFTVHAGSGNDALNVGGDGATYDTGLNGLEPALTFDGGGGTDTLTVDDSADASDNVGTLSATRVTGLGLAAALNYGNTERVDVQLGSGNDAFNVDGTIAGTTTVDTGAGTDTAAVESTGGSTTVSAGTGDDSLTVNADSSSEANPLAGELHLNGQDGNDNYLVNIFGNGGSLVNVFDTGTTDSDADELSINGTSAGDEFLLRASENASSAGGVAFAGALHGDAVERVNYDEALDGLVLEAGGGADTVALDDNWAETTIRGGAGEDVFQVGQIFQTPRDAANANVAAEDEFETAETTRGFLSNGVSFATTIEGGDDGDTFTVFRNVAELNLKGEDGDDVFAVRSFAEEGSVASTVGLGEGSDTVEYVSNAPVDIEGGDGTDALRVIGTEFGDEYVLTDADITGGGLDITYSTIEVIEIDGAEGDDTFTVHSTPAGVSTNLYGGLGNDRFEVAGDSADSEGPHNLSAVAGPLEIDGAGGDGSAGGLGDPVMLPGETNQADPDGTVLTFTGTGEGGATDTVAVATEDIADEGDLVGRTLIIVKGPGRSRFWQIAAVSEDGGTTTLTLLNPSHPAGEWGLPDGTSGFAISDLAATFFVNEAEVIDRATFFDDGASADLGELTADALTGLGLPEGGVPYTNLETLEVLLGAGDDTFTVSGSADNTVAAVHGGGGNDSITVTGRGDAPLAVYGDTSAEGRYTSAAGTVAPGEANAFAADGDDTIDVSAMTDTAIVDAGGGDDVITGGAAGDHLAGGAGNDLIEAAAGDDIVFGDGRFTVDLDLAAEDRFSPFGTADDLAAVFAVTADETAGDDTITGGSGFDIVFGDNGQITQADDTRRVETTDNVTEAATTDAGRGGDDVITGGEDSDLTFGGSGDDAITDGGDGSPETVFGDNGSASFADGVMTAAGSIDAETGGDDTITTGDDTDLVIAGPGGDRIETAGGADIVLGDNGQVGLAGGSVTTVNSSDAEFGGNDVISTGDDTDLVIAGSGNDEVSAGTDDAIDVVLGDSGSAVIADGVLASAAAAGSDFSGDDTIATGLASDVVLAGGGNDVIDADGGDDVADYVVGDNGTAAFTGGVLTELASADATDGGDDVISTGDGPDVVIAGSGDDELAVAGTDGAADYALGDNGQALFTDAGVLTSLASTDADRFGDDTITTGEGDDVIVAGGGDDVADADGGDGASDYVIGDAGRVTLVDGEVAELLATDPEFGGDDVISTGNGFDAVIAGTGDDSVSAGGDDQVADHVVGDAGRVTVNGSEEFADGEQVAALGFNFTGKKGKALVSGTAGVGDGGTAGWNNLFGGRDALNDEAGEPLYFDDGLYAPGVTIEWGVDLDGTPGELSEDRHNQNRPRRDQDMQLFKGYVFADADETLGVEINGLAGHFVTYDVYVYIDADDGRSQSGSSVRSVTDGTTTYYLDDPDGNTFAGTYVRATSTDPDAPQAGHYVVFSGLTGDTFSLRVAAEGGGTANRPAVSGIQVVGERHPIDRVETLDAAFGGDDTVTTGGGPDVVLGGTGADLIETFGPAVHGATDNDVVAGDNARATVAAGDVRDIAAAASGNVTGQGDDIATGNGDDLVIGGEGGDVIDTGVRGEYDNGDVRVLSLNFNSAVPEGKIDGVAGAVAAPNWNNLIELEPGDLRDLEDDGGNDPTRTFGDAVFGDGTSAGGVNVAWGYGLDTGEDRSAGRDIHTEIDADSQNDRLFEGYLFTSVSRTLGVDITGLSGHFDTYDVYVYIDADDTRSETDRSSRRVTDGTTTYYLDDADGDTFQGEFVEVDSTDPNAPAVGNYVVFRDVTGDTFSVRIDDDDTFGDSLSNRPAVAAIQVVGGPDKDDVVINGDNDRDAVAGDNAAVQMFDGEVYELTAMPAGDDGVGFGDVITAGVQGDLIVGGDGDDTLSGGDGNDVLLGDAAGVQAFGGEVLGLNSFGNTIDTEEDDDAFGPFGVPGLDVFVGNDGTGDLSAGGADVIEGGRDDDLTYGQGGDDTYVFAGGQLGDDVVAEFGGLTSPANDRNDALDFRDFAGPAAVDLGSPGKQTVNPGTREAGESLTLTFFSGSSIEHVIGSEFGDRVEGNARDNVIVGLGGDDEIEGESGDDLLLGMAGDDTVEGGRGDDIVDGGDGDDLLLGSPGSDDDDETDDAGVDVVLGGTGADTIFGGGGNDLLAGEAGGDALFGGANNDIILGGDGVDVLRGEAGRDTLEGGAGVDDLTGPNGNDTVEEGQGAGLLGLLAFFVSFEQRFGLDGFGYDEQAGPDDRPVRPWLDTLLTVYYSQFGNG